MTHTPHRFKITLNGDDAPILFTSDNYAEAEAEAKRRSDHWLGTRMFGPSGRIATFKDGRCTGYRDGDTGRWIDTTN